MGKIKNKEKGITLIEILIYMSIFSFISIFVISSLFYFQKIIQNNNQNYYIKNQIYTNLNILQKYAYKNYLNLQTEGQLNDLSIIDKNQNILLTQKIENNQLKNFYSNKSFTPFENIYFSDYKISFLENNRLLRFEISWKDGRGIEQKLIDYIIVINQNL